MRLDRRGFFGALVVVAAAPAVPRRVYSFLWDNPLSERERVMRFIELQFMEAVRRMYATVPDYSEEEIRRVVRQLNTFRVEPLARAVVESLSTPEDLRQGIVRLRMQVPVALPYIVVEP